MSELFGLLAWGSAGWGDELAAGAAMTIALALCTLPFGLLLGFGLALARNSGVKELVTAGDIFTTIFRGLPELLTIFIIYFGLSILVGKASVWLTGEPWDLNQFVAGMIALGIVFASFASETIMSAMKAIPGGQREAARALGMNSFQTWVTVTMPQLIRYALPGLSNLWLVLLKETALVSVIALSDLLRMTNIAVGNTKEPFFFYLVCCLIYLGFALLSSIFIGAIEKWTNRGEAARGPA
ncbi:MAG: ABC transporter permease [Hyphomicrobiales bacterium]